MSTCTSIFRGIDLGSHHSCCASALTTESAAIRVDVNDLSNRSTPSIVAITTDKRRIIGEDAEAQLSRNPKQTYTNIVSAAVACAKTSDLTNISSEAIRDKFNCQWNPNVPIDFGNDKEYNLNECHLFGIFLKKLLSLKNLKGVEQQENVVLALPDNSMTDNATCKESIFQFFSKALQLANYSRTIKNVELTLHSECLASQWLRSNQDAILRSVNESSDKTMKKPLHILICDIGYTQSTIALLEVKMIESELTIEVETEKKEPQPDENETTESKTTEEESESQIKTVTKIEKRLVSSIIKKKTSEVGVFNFVNQLAEFGVTFAKKKWNKDINLKSKQGYKLQTALQKALKELSMLPETNVGLECFFEDESDFVMDLKRADLEEAVLPVVKLIEDNIREVMQGLPDNTNDNGDVEMPDAQYPNNNSLPNFSVEIVGGGVRIPCVADAISKCTNTEELRRGLDGSSAVATGACVLASSDQTLTSNANVIGTENSLNNNFSLFLSKDSLLLDGFSAYNLKNSESMNATSDIEIELEMEQLEEKESRRMFALNRFESYIYEAKAFISPGAESKQHFTDVDQLEKAINDAENWFLDHVDITYPLEDIITQEQYEEKYNELLDLVTKKHGEKWFVLLKEREEKLSKELSEAYAARQAEDKEDHDSRKLPNPERVRMAEKQRVEGNDMFKAGSFMDAILRYNKAQAQLGKLFDTNPEIDEEKKRIALSCYLNTAQCYLKAVEGESDKNKTEQIYKKVERNCDLALEQDDKSVKALYRKGLALEKLGEIDKARQTIKTALKIDEKDANLVRLDKVLERAQVVQKKKQSKMYGKMFG